MCERSRQLSAPQKVPQPFGGSMQILHSCCLCSSLLVNQLSETARLELLTNSSIHKALPSQIDYIFRGKEWPCCEFTYLFIMLSSPRCCVSPLTACLCGGLTWASCDSLRLPQSSLLPALLLAGLFSLLPHSQSS